MFFPPRMYIAVLLLALLSAGPAAGQPPDASTDL